MTPVPAHPAAGPVTVLGIGGSLRDPSRTEAMLDLALDGARAAGAAVNRWTVREDPLPFYSATDHGDAAVERYLKLVESADALILASPAYHGSVAAPVKNLLDHLDALRDRPLPYLAGKVVGVASVGDGTMGPVQTAGALVQMAHALRAIVVPLQVAECRAEAATGDGRPEISGETVRRLTVLGQLVVATAARLRHDGR